MTPEREKALSIIIKFQFSKPPLMFDKAKQCALICVDEILKIHTLRSTKKAAKLDRYSESDSGEYWQEVKQEIKQLN